VTEPSATEPSTPESLPAESPPAESPPAGPRGAVVGPDGRQRCPWGVGPSDLGAYHDDEWGYPVRDDRGLYERLCLEAFQSGLSWLTILRKRENFRAAFHGFDPEQVAKFGPDDVTRLLGDVGIVRNRAKIEATIANARAAIELPDGLAALVWRYADDETRPAPVTGADVPSSTPAAKALSADLRRNGFRFTGPVTAYAAMQACGVVNDHLADCFRRTAQ
jgi:DNA-3-methyladenine glycosylase I